jgi:hypothetical protein
MSEYSRYRDADRYGRTSRSTGQRLLGYLRTRSSETWVFFAAGRFLGALRG